MFIKPNILVLDTEDKEYIYNLMKEKGISLREVARRIGVSASYLCAILKGIRNVNLDRYNEIINTILIYVKPEKKKSLKNKHEVSTK